MEEIQVSFFLAVVECICLKIINHRILFGAKVIVFIPNKNALWFDKKHFSFHFFFYSEKKTKQKKRRRCISELNGKFIVLKTKIQKLASLKQSEFFNVFLTIFSYSEIRRWIYNKVDCADICYLLLVAVCSSGVFYPNVCVFYPRFLTTYSYLTALKRRNKIDRGQCEALPLCTRTIHHLPSRDAVTENMHRRLRICFPVRGLVSVAIEFHSTQPSPAGKSIC